MNPFNRKPTIITMTQDEQDLLIESIVSTMRTMADQIVTLKNRVNVLEADVGTVEGAIAEWMEADDKLTARLRTAEEMIDAMDEYLRNNDDYDGDTCDSVEDFITEDEADVLIIQEMMAEQGGIVIAIAD